MLFYLYSFIYILYLYSFIYTLYRYQRSYFYFQGLHCGHFTSFGVHLARNHLGNRIFLFVYFFALVFLFIRILCFINLFLKSNRHYHVFLKHVPIRESRSILWSTCCNFILFKNIFIISLFSQFYSPNMQ